LPQQVVAFFVCVLITGHLRTVAPTFSLFEYLQYVLDDGGLLPVNAGERRFFTWTCKNETLLLSGFPMYSLQGQ
jgi:hypothetical protein